MSAPRAIVFDLYGTLLATTHPVFRREISRLDPGARRAWAGFERDILLVTPFSSHEDFVDAILTRFGRTDDRAFRDRALSLLREELDSVHLLPGVVPLLGLLKRRGIRLGLLTNSASPYREPVERTGLAPLFDAVLFSCDARARKPEPALYREVCSRLGVDPRFTVMVGDSLVNDVMAPCEAGLRAILVGQSRRALSVAKIGELGFWAWDEAGAPHPLLSTGQFIELGGRGGELVSFEPLAETEQGRYNLVARGTARIDGAMATIYLKRFLHPQSAAVELFVHELLPEFGLESLETSLLAGLEPLLVSAAAPGEKLSSAAPRIERALAVEIGRHFACGYLLSNADLRPRNAFLHGTAAAPRLVMVDHEYCLLNLALDLEGVAERYDRRGLEALGEQELRRRIVRRVLTPQTMRRARRAFLDLPAKEPELARGFREGWMEVHALAQRNADRIRQRIADRLAQPEDLIVGTHAYRRALMRLDLEELMARIAGDPGASCAPCL